MISSWRFLHSRRNYVAELTSTNYKRCWYHFFVRETRLAVAQPAICQINDRGLLWKLMETILILGKRFHRNGRLTNRRWLSSHSRFPDVKVIVAAEENQWRTCGKRERVKKTARIRFLFRAINPRAIVPARARAHRVLLQLYVMTNRNKSTRASGELRRLINLLHFPKGKPS